jgi:Domain of unknown function (DUF4410)
VSRYVPAPLLPALFGAFALVLLAAQTPAPYSTVEIDPFLPAPNVDFPREYQSALVDDIARELSVEFPTLMILRPGDSAPGERLLRISGTVTAFKPGSRTKRSLIGFGAGAAIVSAQVVFQDAAGRRPLSIREMTGSSGMTGVDSQEASESLSKKIAQLCKAAHWLSN